VEIRLADRFEEVGGDVEGRGQKLGRQPQFRQALSAK
jgi:hypothetical protein